MIVISFINQKGGVGKTTLAIHLGVVFSNHNYKTVIFDLDPQVSATEWFDERKDSDVAVLAVPAHRLKPAINKAKEIGTEVVIIDTAPHSETSALEAARVATLVIIPCKPSILDLRAMKKTVELLKLAKLNNVCAVLNSTPRIGIDTKQAEEAIKKNFNINVCPLDIGERVAYRRCLIDGKIAQEFEPRGKAAEEMEAFFMWTCENVGKLERNNDKQNTRFFERAI